MSAKKQENDFDLILLTVPIGNLQDITLRVKSALQEGHLFAVEDTRNFRKLLGLLGISEESKKIVSFHEHTSMAEREKLLDWAKQDGPLYLASDAGSPIISDPAFPLVLEAYKKGLKVTSFGGISAVHVALEMSGLPPLPYYFLGFFPRQKRAQEQSLQKILLGHGTFIFFESPERILDTLEFLTKNLPQAQFCVARELTKKFETVYRFTGQTYQGQEIRAQGEFVLLIHTSAQEGEEVGVRDKELEELAQLILEEGAKKRPLSRMLAKILRKDPKEIYRLLSQS